MPSGDAVAANLTLGRFKAADASALILVANADRTAVAEVALPVEGERVVQFNPVVRSWKLVIVEKMEGKAAVKVENLSPKLC